MNPRSAIGFLAVYNVAQNRFFNRRGYVPANLAVTGAGILWARRSGITMKDLGLGRAHLRSGLRVGLIVGASAVAVAVATRDLKTFEALLRDQRLDKVGPREIWYRLLVRFPVGTALFEDVWFRGILPASLRRAGVSRPDLVASGVFAAWHLIPTSVAVNANPRGRQLSSPEKAIPIVAGSILAGVGGLGFAALRNASKSIAAPFVAHAVVNGLVFWSALRRTRQNS